MDYTKPFKCILEIEKCGSISLAAEKLSIQQPTLSKYLKKVETELGVELFDRSSNPIRLTEAGRCFVETARTIIDADNQLQKQLTEIADNIFDISIGISPSRAPYLLPTILKRFINTFPNVHVTVYEETTSELINGLVHGELNLMISVLDTDTKAFDHIKLFDETVLLAVPETSPFIDFQKAFTESNIISPGKGQLLSELMEIMPDHDSIIECQNIVTALSMVRAGIGVTLVPSYLADYGDTNGIRFIDLPVKYTETANREICLFYRKEQFLSSAEKAFIASSQEVPTH